MQFKIYYFIENGSCLKFRGDVGVGVGVVAKSKPVERTKPIRRFLN